MSVFALDSEGRILDRALGSTATETVSGVGPPEPVPYTTAGIRPDARRRFASFFPRPSRVTASSVASICVLYSFNLHKQRRHRGLVMDVADRLSQEPGHRQHDNLPALLRLGPLRHRVGDN